jgi:hypothetical protein
VVALLFQLIRWRKTGEVTACPSGCGPKPKLTPCRVAAKPEITLTELQAWSLAERKVNVSIGCL